jgi:hypothetical protein
MQFKGSGFLKTQPRSLGALHSLLCLVTDLKFPNSTQALRSVTESSWPGKSVSLMGYSGDEVMGIGYLCAVCVCVCERVLTNRVRPTT